MSKYLVPVGDGKDDTPVGDSWPCATCGSGEHNTSQHGTGFSAEQHEWEQARTRDSE